MTNNPEAFSRVLIDKELENSKWNLLDFIKYALSSTHTAGGQIIC